MGLLILAAGAPSLLGYSEMSRRIGKGLTTEWPHQWNAQLGKLVSPGIYVVKLSAATETGEFSSVHPVAVAY